MATPQTLPAPPAPPYTLTDDVGHSIRLKVSFTDDRGAAESVTSAVAAAPAEANNPATGLPSISGTPQVEQTLTMDTAGISDQDGLSNVSYSYQWMAGGADIDGATGDSLALTTSQHGQTIQVRVDFTDDAGNNESLISEATDAVAAKPTPLTASFSGVAGSHDGSTWFTFDLAFSENVKAGYQRIRDDAFTISGGNITKAKRKVQGSNQNWTITVEPDGNGTVSITLPETTECDAAGAICTAGGKKLSGRVELTVNGPEPPSQEQEQAGDDQQTPESPPAKPTNLTATVNADGHIVLSWEAPDDDSVTGYQILRRRPTEGEATLLVNVADTQSTATTFTDTGVTAGVKHVYRVKAINAAGLSDWSNYVNPTP